MHCRHTESTVIPNLLSSRGNHHIEAASMPTLPSCCQHAKAAITPTRDFLPPLWRSLDRTDAARKRSPHLASRQVAAAARSRAQPPLALVPLRWAVSVATAQRRAAAAPASRSGSQPSAWAAGCREAAAAAGLFFPLLPACFFSWCVIDAAAFGASRGHSRALRRCTRHALSNTSRQSERTGRAVWRAANEWSMSG